MKIAILGNMNNNGFAIMRYLRDLGVDAHLLLYANDGVGTLAHFRPEDDTWDIDRWAPYIHQTPIVNSPYAALTGKYVLFNFLLALIMIVRQTRRPWLHWISGWRLRKILNGYDVYIASGIAPALFCKINRQLDVFFPYATGVEHLGAQELTSRLPDMGTIKKAIALKAANTQREGIKSARFVFSAEYSLTREVLSRSGARLRPIAIPMPYREHEIDPALYSVNLNNVLASIGQRKYVLAIARQVWIRPTHMSVEEWRRESKNSDWLIRAFAALCQERPNHGLLLVLAEYGPDVSASKILCNELGIEDRVLWMPRLARKELSVIAENACAIAGEFKEVDEMIWGGVGWEALAASTPLIHSFRFAPGRYEEIFGVPRPPVLSVITQFDVYAHLVKLVDEPHHVADVGRQSGEWFSLYNGLSLAGRWLDLISKID